MLILVRGGAILGCFSFTLAFVGLLLPENAANPSLLLLLMKYGAALAISFFALRGTAEPAESYESPKFPTPSVAVPAATKALPVAPSAASLDTRTTPAVPAPKPVPPAQAPVAPPASGGRAPAPNSLQGRLVDVEAPPVPNRSYPLCPPPEGLVSQRWTFIVSSLLFGIALVGLCYLLGITWLVVAFSLFFGLALVILFFGRNSPVGTCPFCGGLIQRYNRLRPEPVSCDNCFEISKFENERFSPYDPNAVAETPIFRSPLFENSAWPDGCVLCGAPPTHFDDAKAVRYQARRLATPLASSVFVPHPAARVTGVPYCAQHRDALRVIPPKEMFAWTPWNYVPGFAERMEARRKAFLMWRSLPMMRRYLEANRHAKSGVSAGYREPNLLQKTVSAAFGKPEPQGTSASPARPSPNKPGR